MFVNVNYIIVEADEFLKNAAIERINREHRKIKKVIEESDGDYNYTSGEFNAPGHILFCSGKMLESEIKDFLHEDDRFDLILWGITVTFTNAGNIIIYLHYSDIFGDLIINSLEDSNISYDTYPIFGDLELFVNREDEDNIKKWLQNLQNLIERSKEYEQLLNDINKWQKVFGN